MKTTPRILLALSLASALSLHPAQAREQANIMPTTGQNLVKKQGKQIGDAPPLAEDG